MPSQTWTLTEVANRTHEDAFRVAADDRRDAQASWSVSQQTLRGGLSDGVDIVEIDNGRMNLTVLPTRGMGIWRAEVDGEALAWRSPVRGPVHPKFVPTFDPSGLGWLEGFDELLVRCGLESNGAPEFDAQGRLLYPLHGRIASRPAHLVSVTVDDSAGEITLRGVVEETRFHFQKLRLETSITTRFDSRSFTINDRVLNYGGTTAEMQMLYHLNLGEPLLAAGDEIVAPVRSIKNRDSEETDALGGWNRYGPPVPGQAEHCFFLELHADRSNRTRVLLKRPNGEAGTSVEYDAQSLPCFTLWKNMVASADGYVTGLEPGVNFPNPRSVEAEQGRVVRLAPGERWSTSLTVQRLVTADEVTAAEEAIRGLATS